MEIENEVFVNQFPNLKNPEILALMIAAVAMFYNVLSRNRTMRSHNPWPACYWEARYSTYNYVKEESVG
jgi:hypothetical protein